MKICALFVLVLLLTLVLGIQAAQEQKAADQEPGVQSPEHMLAEILAEHTGVPMHETETRLNNLHTGYARAQLVREILKVWKSEQEENNKELHYWPYMSYRCGHEENRRSLVRQAQEVCRDIETEKQAHQDYKMDKIKEIGWESLESSALEELLEQDRVACEQRCAQWVQRLSQLKEAITKADQEYEAARASAHIEYEHENEQIAGRMEGAKSRLNQFFAGYMPNIIIDRVI